MTLRFVEIGSKTPMPTVNIVVDNYGDTNGNGIGDVYFEIELPHIDAPSIVSYDRNELINWLELALGQVKNAPYFYEVGDIKYADENGTCIINVGKLTDDVIDVEQCGNVADKMTYIPGISKFVPTCPECRNDARHGKTLTIGHID